MLALSRPETAGESSRLSDASGVFFKKAGPLKVVLEEFFVGWRTPRKLERAGYIATDADKRHRLHTFGYSLDGSFEAAQCGIWGGTR